MDNNLFIEVLLHWIAVITYSIAAIVNAAGVFFKKERAESTAYWIIAAGLVIHGAGIIFRWAAAGHGPYMARYEVFSSDAWIVLFLFMVLVKMYPKIRTASVVVFPAAFLLIAIGIFSSADVSKLPPTLNSIWLVLHVIFYKVSLGTLLVGVAFSVFYIMKTRKKTEWLSKLPEPDVIDIYAYRFAGFSFTFWTIAMLAGSIWAYDSWGRFWAWDPIETWSLIAWILFGINLHLRRFFGLKGTRAAWFFILCFIVALVSAFLVPFIESSIHAEYFQ